MVKFWSGSTFNSVSVLNIRVLSLVLVLYCSDGGLKVIDQNEMMFFWFWYLMMPPCLHWHQVFYSVERKYMTALLLADAKGLVVPHGMKASQYERLIDGQLVGGSRAAASASSAASGKASSGQPQTMALEMTSADDDGTGAGQVVSQKNKKSYYIPTGKPKGRPRKMIQQEVHVSPSEDVNPPVPPDVSADTAPTAPSPALTPSAPSTSIRERFKKKPRLEAELKKYDQDIADEDENMEPSQSDAKGCAGAGNGSSGSRGRGGRAAPDRNTLAVESQLKDEKVDELETLLLHAQVWCGPNSRVIPVQFQYSNSNFQLTNSELSNTIFSLNIKH